MKLRLSSFLGLFLALTLSLWAGPRETQWQAVDEAVKNGLPKTAIERLEPIIAGALADGAHAEAIKAIARKIALEGQAEGGKPERIIARLEAEAAQAPAEMKPVLEAILAHWYWNFFQQNRWRFAQRTQTGASPGADLLTWDLPRILAEIDRHFTAALASEAALQRIPIGEFDDLLIKGTVPDIYRPTLYDFLAYQALLFYQAGEQGAIRAEDTFEVEAGGPILADTEAFLAWQPADAGTASPLLKAIRLHQKLLRFHQGDADRSAYYDADLARIEFGLNSAIGETKTEAVEAAFRRLIAATEGHEISARVRAAYAVQIFKPGRYAEAHAVAQAGFDAYPDTAGGALCHNMLEQIEAKSIQINTEFVWNSQPVINVTSRNLARIHFRAVPVDFEARLKEWNGGLLYFDRNISSKLLVTQPAREWSEALPDSGDFETHTVEFPTPADLAPGFYAIIASSDPAFSHSDNQLSLAPVWVSNLALITESRSAGGPTGGFVLQADSGEPVVGAKIQAWTRQNNDWVASPDTITTDANGHFSVPTKNRQTALLARHGDQAVSVQTSLWPDSPVFDRDEEDQAVFFTDRAIYRPGQIIRYSGIAYSAKSAESAHSVLAKRELTVVFQDSNGKELSREMHTTNAYGSFSGSFTAPRNGISGMASIRCEEEDLAGGISFRIEEYKRPKFQVDLPAPADGARLNEAVKLTGQATAYTGAAIGGAKLRWRIERAARLPAWCWWWLPPASTAIAHGTSVTEADGSFRIEFEAKPDRAIPEKLEPIFSYTIMADVTDSTGETRSAQCQLRIGYTALQATLASDDWQTVDQPVKFILGTSTLDGVPQAVAGTLAIHVLQQPAKVGRESLQQTRYWWGVSETPAINPANPDSWPLGEKLSSQAFQSNDKGTGVVSLPLPAGLYRAVLETRDRFGKTVKALRTFQVVDPSAKRAGVKLASFLNAEKWSIEPGEPFRAVWGTGYETGRAFVSVESNGEVLESFWTSPQQTQTLIELPFIEEMNRGVTLHVTQVRENRAYLHSELIKVRPVERTLDLEWTRFRSKLLPGQNETWTLKIRDPRGGASRSELVGTLYDASLDQFARLQWPDAFALPEETGPDGSQHFHNTQAGFIVYNSTWQYHYRPVHWQHRQFNPAIFNAWWRDREVPGAADGDVVMHDAFGEYVSLSPFSITADEDRGYAASATLAGTRVRTELKDVGSAISVVTKQFLKDTGGLPAAGGVGEAALNAKLDQVVARKNLVETAFFLPHIRTNWRGVAKLQFTMPETLTQWKFLGFAHDKQLRAGLITATAVTAKDLMVEPNPPRFVREGDVVEFTVKVSNQSDQPQKGRLRLTFADAATLAPADGSLGNSTPEQPFDLPAKQSRSLAWRIAIPDGQNFLTYKAVGATASLSDGEEGFLPVLSRRVLVTESLPLPVRGPATKRFDFTKLSASGQSDTLRSQSLTVQMVSQPAWYAVMALPYLMEFPHECSEQLFNRLYANALARHIANSNPKIRRTFDLWKNTPALDSPLVKNQDLKAVMIEETPWLRQASRESESRRNVGLLFDTTRLDEESARTLAQLAERQLGDGLWSWFPGGDSSEYISLYIMTGFGRLRHLGVEIDSASAVKSLAGLDAWMQLRYLKIRSGLHPERYVPGYTDALYLYGRSFFLKDQPVAEVHRPMIDFLLGQSRQFWLQVGSRQSQAHLALALQRFGDAVTPAAIVKSLKERSSSSEELGMFWRDAELSWWWYRAPIETQAMMIEAFAEVARDPQAVEDCKVWLLKQKQTQDWKTTKATADAIYGLLLQGSNLLASDALVEVSLGGTPVKPEKVEAGTGFYEQKITRSDITPAMGRITVKKTDAGVSWGSVHWQYLEDMTKVTPHEATPLKLKKTLWVKETTKAGPVLRPVTGPLAVGDELVVRLELRTDREMEFVHLKDQRGSGTEPVNVLSQYKYQDGLAYYESTRDTATHFFIDRLPKGTFVFEYSVRVQLKGRYQSGFAEIQSMYAPEFNAHSESLLLEVK